MICSECSTIWEQRKIEYASVDDEAKKLKPSTDLGPKDKRIDNELLDELAKLLSSGEST